MKIKERALSLLLSLVMVLTFMPALAFAGGDESANADGTPSVEDTVSEEPAKTNEKALEELEGSGNTEIQEEIQLNEDDQSFMEEVNSSAAKAISPDSYVTKLDFKPADAGIRFIFYDGIDSYDQDDFDEDDYSIIGHYKYFPWNFITGDVLEVSYNTGEKEVLSYNEDDWTWHVADSEEEPNYGVRWEDGQGIYDDQTEQYNEWEVGNNTITLYYGYDEEGNEVSTTITAKVLSNPVSEISFEPSSQSDSNRFVFYEGEDYDFWWEEGDKLTAIVNGTAITYEAKEYIDSDGDYSMGFFDASGGIPEYGEVYYNDEDWTVGGENYITIYYAGNECKIAVQLLSNPISSISFTPIQSTYSEAEMRWMEYKYSYEDDDNQPYYTYEYYLEYNEGDILTLTIDGDDVEYVFTEDEDAFVSEDGDYLNGYYLKDLYYEDEYCAQITPGTFTFKGSYKGRAFSADITVTESTDEEIALEEAKITAIGKLDELVDSVNWSAYRIAQQNEIDDVLTNAYESIILADNENAISTILSSAKTSIAAVKTDAQLRIEEEAARVQAIEAARQGTLDGSLPALKASKPKAAKKAITVKWKKLKKKQLKSGVTGIQVWVCSDGAFANGSTIERVVGKKKASLKIKGLQKGVTYYVKVRTVGPNGYGPWSAVKKIKVKK